MGLRAKLRAAVTVWFVAGFGLLVAMVELSGYFVIPLLLLQLTVAGYVMLFLRCPNCGKPVLQNPIPILGTEIYIWTPWMPRHCTDCDFQLDATNTGDPDPGQQRE